MEVNKFSRKYPIFQAKQFANYKNSTCIINGCKGIVTKCHAFARSQLVLIQKNGHVLQYSIINSYINTQTEQNGMKLVGIKEASTFTGFCNLHDSEMFKKIDGKTIEDSTEVYFLSNFRAMCFRNIITIETTAALVNYLGASHQHNPQLDKNDLIEIGNCDGYEPIVYDFPYFQQKYGHAYLTKNYSNLEYCVIYFKGKPWFLGSDLTNFIMNINANPLIYVGRINNKTPFEEISCTIFNAEEGGVIVFAHLNLNQNNLFTQFVLEFNKLSPSQIQEILLHYIFTNFNNIFFSPALSGKQQQMLKHIFNSQLTNDIKLIYNQIKQLPALNIVKVKYKLLSNQNEICSFSMILMKKKIRLHRKKIRYIQNSMLTNTRTHQNPL